MVLIGADCILSMLMILLITNYQNNSYHKRVLLFTNGDRSRNFGKWMQIPGKGEGCLLNREVGVKQIFSKK